MTEPGQATAQVRPKVLGVAAYLNVDVSMFASNFMDSVVNQLFADIDNYVIAKVPPFLAALTDVWLGRRWLRPRRRPARIAGLLAPVLLVSAKDGEVDQASPFSAPLSSSFD